MSTTNVDPQLLQEMVKLLVPHMTTEAERQAILGLALSDAAYRRIDFHGPPDVFTMNMVSTLLKYGEDDRGKQTILTVLDVIHAQVGINNQRKIDQLRQQLQLNFYRACPHCNKPNQVQAKFCKFCGKKVSSMPLPSQPAPVVPKTDSAPLQLAKKQYPWVVIGVVLVLFLAIIIIWQLWTNGYTITISNPTDSITCPDKSRCQFAVEGAISKKVVNDPALDIYVFVSPLNAGNWYLQVTPAAIDPKGAWRQTPSQIGNQDEPVTVGDTFQIVALVVPKDATIEGRKLSEWTPGQPIRSYRNIEHLAASNLVVLHVN